MGVMNQVEREYGDEDEDDEEKPINGSIIEVPEQALFIPSLRGGKKVIRGGHCYRVRDISKATGKVTWKCDVIRCKARIKTNGMHEGCYIVEVLGEHYHPFKTYRVQPEMYDNAPKDAIYIPPKERNNSTDNDTVSTISKKRSIELDEYNNESLLKKGRCALEENNGSIIPQRRRRRSSKIKCDEENVTVQRRRRRRISSEPEEKGTDSDPSVILLGENKDINFQNKTMQPGLVPGEVKSLLSGNVHVPLRQPVHTLKQEKNLVFQPIPILQG